MSPGYFCQGSSQENSASFFSPSLPVNRPMVQRWRQPAQLWGNSPPLTKPQTGKLSVIYSTSGTIPHICAAYRGGMEVFYGS